MYVFNILISYLLLRFISYCNGYVTPGRFGHSAVLINDSVYFYGGDASVNSSRNRTDWLSDISILPVRSSYSLTDPPWKPASGPQDTVGGPAVYSHIAFMGGNNNMIIIGGVMPQMDVNKQQPTTTVNADSDEEPTAYSYDCDLGRWNSFSLPGGNHLNRQGAGCTPVGNGVVYIWGGKRASLSPSNSSRPSLPSAVYKMDSVNMVNSTLIKPSEPGGPSLRYAHTQTLISGHRIVVLGGFDGSSGEALSMADVWIFDIATSKWSQIKAKLDREDKPANRSSHSQVLMPDGVSILIYGGYDGYHVYNDVAVLDTRTWTWTVKNTNAAVQGRADHTATLVNNNMIVAFGFTGVSTSLTVMSDIEVLDIVTWSWTSVYIPSSGYNGIGEGNGGRTGITADPDGSDLGSNSNNQRGNIPSSPSVAIIAGAVTGGLVVFVLILVTFYLINKYYKQKRQLQNRKNEKGLHGSNRSYTSDEDDMSEMASSVLRTHHHHHDIFKEPRSSTEPFEYNSSRRPSAQTHPLQQLNPKRSDTIGTSTTLVPSPWASSSLGSSSVKRAASTPTYHHPIQSISAAISKPDDRHYDNNTIVVRRAVTLSESNTNNNNNNSNNVVDRPKSIPLVHDVNDKEKEAVKKEDDDDDEDNSFDRQEFILLSEEVSIKEILEDLEGNQS